MGPGGQRVTPEEFQKLEVPAGMGPKAIAAGLAGQTNVSTELSGGGNIGENLAQVQAELNRPNLHPVAKKALEDEQVRLLNAQQGNATEIGPEGARGVGKAIQVDKLPPKGGGPINVVRGPDGKLIVAGATPASATASTSPSTPGPTASLEEATKSLNTAQTILRSYTLSRRKGDAKGYEKAQAAVEKAQQALDVIQEAERKAVSGGRTMPLRTK